MRVLAKYKKDWQHIELRARFLNETNLTAIKDGLLVAAFNPLYSVEKKNHFFPFLYYDTVNIR